MTTRLTIQSIRTEKYQFSHSHEPRGNGFWCFNVEWAAEGKEIKTFVGSYTSAKKQLMASIRTDKRIAIAIEVLP